jgi:hypothetical protein
VIGRDVRFSRFRLPLAYIVREAIERVQAVAIHPLPARKQACLAPQRWLNERSRHQTGIVDTVLRHQGEIQAARDQRQRPIVPWGRRRDFVDRYP